VPFNFSPAKKLIDIQLLLEFQQITIAFSPVLIETHNAKLLVQTQGGLTWTFPLYGVPEGTIAELGKVFKLPARSRVDEAFSLSISGLRQGNIREEFDFKLAVEEPEYQKVMDRAIRITLANPVISNKDIPLEFKLTFEPLRPVEVSTHLIIIKKSGGRWKYPMKFIVSEPQVDDVIKIQSSINRTATVAFKITNQFEVSADFKAYMSVDSPEVFSVSPRHGVLEPLGSATGGTEFLVSFTPLEYGKSMVGKLVIETEDMQWTYEIRGTHPKYVPPNPRSVVDTGNRGGNSRAVASRSRGTDGSPKNQR